MSQTYCTKDGDTVDAIAWLHYGREAAAVDILEANPRLADHGPILPAGVQVTLPDLPAPVEPAAVRLWD
jgi:phage tail protein X